MMQAPEFNLKKPPAYNYDFALLGVITAAFGLIGLPPVNGVLPQVRACTFDMFRRRTCTGHSRIVKSQARNALPV